MRPPVKIMILKNNSLPEVRFGQSDLGDTAFGIKLKPFDFVIFAKACGAAAFPAATSSDLRPAIDTGLRSSGARVTEVVVDGEAPPATPRGIKV